MADILFLLSGGLALGAVYALIAIGLVAIHKATGTVNFAHGGFILLGAFAAFLVVVEWKLPAWAMYVVAPVAVGAAACVLEVIVLRPLRHKDAFSVVIATVFLGIALSEAFRLTYHAEILAVPQFWQQPPMQFGEFILTHDAVWTFAAAIAIGTGAILVFHKARIGRGMRAMASNPRGAQLCGYAVDRVYAFAWFFGGALAGLAGVFAAPTNGVSPELANSAIAAAFVASVLGGMNSLRGAVLGGFVLGMAETLAAAYISSAFKSAISFLLLFAILMWRPNGLFPEVKERHV